MSEVGIRTEADRAELIDGEIVEMTAVGGRHVARVNRLTRFLMRYGGEDAIVGVQSPVQLAENQEQVPDPRTAHSTHSSVRR
ncbi:MAG: Uma2 family endonuclease [Chloroflexi bacterium]|nr:Uma2 family endonuclease [Chloroflexota bacterium]